MVQMPTADEIAALRQALSDALGRNDALAGELRVVRTERDLLKEQLNRFKRQLFEAKSEVGAAHQKDLFFNEAEIEGSQAEPAAEEPAGEEVSRVSSKPVSTRAERRQVVVRGKTETQARGKSEGVVGKGVAELRGRGLQPEGRAIVGQRT